MTENVLQKLEEKVMALLTELEDLRDEVEELSRENIALREEKTNALEKMQSLISLLDSVELDCGHHDSKDNHSESNKEGYIAAVGS